MALWTLRLLLRAGAFERLVTARDWPNGEMLGIIGIPYELGHELVPAAMRRLCERLLADLESDPPARDCTLLRNAAMLGDKLRLSEVEQDLVALAAAFEAEYELCDSGTLGGRTPEQLRRTLAKVLGVPLADIRQALHPRAPLRAMSLIKVRSQAVGRRMESPLTLLDPLDTLLFSEVADGDELLVRFFRPAAPPTLGLDDFPHCAADAEVLVGYLERVLSERREGVNVLVYGAPGAGKTELVRAVAAALEAPLVEVNIADEDGDPLSRERRMGACRLCQHFLMNQPGALMLFDEIEDVFPRSQRGMFGLRQDSGSDKGWTNRLLEHNRVPMLWIGNHVDQMDPAFVRRFDIVLQLGAPPPAVRRRILDGHTAGLELSERWRQRAAGDERLLPAHFERAARVARAIPLSGAEQTERVFDRLLEGSLTAQGVGGRRSVSTVGACGYDLAFVHASCDLEQVTRGLAARRAGTICLYGPPGTGKSAYAAHVARELDQPLSVRRASDLMSCWVGRTEQNIAAMFRAARDEGAVLLLDEADSFFRDRRAAQHSWELTEVNELLVQMEAFEGIFICATNLIDVFDQAAFRRFALEIRFDPLQPTQRWAMLSATLRQANAPMPRGRAARRLRADLDRLATVTPGDYAAVVRRSELLDGALTARALVEALSEACRLKRERVGGAVDAIGFRAG